jgi:site-specific recombinase XerD
MDNPRAVRISGPLTRLMDGFCVELGECGYPPESASLQLRLMAHLSRWLEGQGLEARDLTPARVEEFLRARRAAGYRYLLSPRAVVPLMGYLSRVGAVSTPAPAPSPADVLLAGYARHLTADRGLAPSTVATYTTVAGRVLAHWEDQKGWDVGRLSAGEVSVLALAECRRRRVPSAKAFITALRSWLRFLSAEELTSHDLAGAVPAVAGWRAGWVPRGLSETELTRLVGSVDPTTAVGLRDRAVIVLLVRLALRVGEAAQLVLDDLDWRHGEITVRGKGRRTDRLPLPVDVGEALAAYLHDGRPRASCRALFLRAHAPLVGLSPDGMGGIVARAGQRAGVPASAHRLRHSAATAILRGGGSLAEVGQVLRHADVATSAIYAKVDHRALAALAQPWPGSPA